MVTKKLNDSFFKCYVSEELIIAGIYDENPHLIVSDLNQIFYGNEEGLRLKLYLDERNSRIHITFRTKDVGNGKDVGILNNLKIDNKSRESLKSINANRRINFYLFKDIDKYQYTIEFKESLPYMPIFGTEIY
jgi:hypothetical protein